MTAPVSTAQTIPKGVADAAARRHLRYGWHATGPVGTPTGGWVTCPLRERTGCLVHVETTWLAWAAPHERQRALRLALVEHIRTEHNRSELEGR